MESFQGNLLKMKASEGELVQYALPLGEQLVPMNQYLGKKITLTFEGQINCIASGEKIKKSYGQGYSYKSFITLPECDMCIVKPEQCHFAKGTCRDSAWGEKNCMIPHVLYLARSSQVKVGITREHQVPTRWMDQGASEALPILRFSSRYNSGLMEVEISKIIHDKTNWRKMLMGVIEDQRPLEGLREEIYQTMPEIIDSLDGEEIISAPRMFNYPRIGDPKKMVSFDFDKTPQIEGVLIGIKGQYLLFEHGVLNIRKHQGYFIKLDV